MRFITRLLLFGFIVSTVYVNLPSSQTPWEFKQNGDFCALEATSAGVPLRVQYDPPSEKNLNFTIIEIERPNFLFNWWYDEINWPPTDAFHSYDEENDYKAIFGVMDFVKMDLPMRSHYGEDAQTSLGEDHNIVRMFIANLVQKKSVEILMDHNTSDGFRVSRLGWWTTNRSAEDEKTLEKFKNCVFGN